MAPRQLTEASIFNIARKLQSADHREDYLTEACGGDDKLRLRVETLLAAHDEASKFLERPAIEQFGASLESDAPVQPEVMETAKQDNSPEVILLGAGHHSVLKILDQTVNDVPRVALRESASLAEPIVRPKSADLPKSASDSRYELHGEIARGGMGAIFKGRDVDLGRDLAIKVLLDVHGDKPEAVQRFVEEAQIGGQLQHPGIAPIYELGQLADKRVFFSMKLVKGQTLSKLLSSRADPATDRAKFIGIFEQICQTMAYAHSRGVIHRDLKPANIMVGAFGEVQVMDWGLAKVLSFGGVADEQQSQQLQLAQSIIKTIRSADNNEVSPLYGSADLHTQLGSVMGTPAYMPPEQALGEVDRLDERSDVFGLGAILCEILTGAPPYVGKDGTDVFRQAVRGKLDDCMARLDDCGCDKELIELARLCLEVEPTDRPRDASVLSTRITSYLESVELRLRDAEIERAAHAARADAQAAQAAAEHLRAEAESARASAERKRRHTSLALAAAVLLLVGVGSGGSLYLLQQKADRQTAEADAQRYHAREMQVLADQRDKQRNAAEQERIVAVAAQRSAEDAQEQGRRLLYATDMQLAPLLWKDNRSTAAQLRSRLDVHSPDKNADLKGREDLRGFEWYYYDKLVEQPDGLFGEPGIAIVDAKLTSEVHLVTLSKQGQVQSWDLISGQEDISKRRILPGGDQAQELVLSPDGQLVALGMATQVQVFDAASAKEKWHINSYGDGIRSINDIRRLNFSPDSRKLVVMDDKIRWLNAADGNTTGTTRRMIDSRVGRLALSKDGSSVAISHGLDKGNLFTVFQQSTDGGNGTTLVSNVKCEGTIGVVALSPDGRRIAVGYQFDGSMVMFDAINGQQLASHPSAHGSPLASIAFSPDGTALATAEVEGTVKVWHDIDKLNSSSQPLVTLKGNRAKITNLGFSGEGTKIFRAGADGTTRVWELNTSDGSMQPFGASSQAVFSPDGDIIATIADGLNCVQLWDATTGQQLRQLPSIASEHIDSIAFSPKDQHLLAVGCSGPQQVSHITLWDIEAMTERARLAGATDLPNFRLRSESGSVSALAFSPDGKFLVAGFGSKSTLGWQTSAFPLKVWEMETRQLIHHLTGHTGFCVSLDFSPDGSLLASGSYDGQAIIWSTDKWKSRQKLVNPDSEGSKSYIQGMVNDVSFSPDGATLAMASSASNVHLWDLNTGKHKATLAGHVGRLISLVFSPDGRTLATGGTDQVRLWNLATNRELMALDTGKLTIGDVPSIEFSPDGMQLLAAGSLNTILWSATPRAKASVDRVTRQIETLLATQADVSSTIRMASENLDLHEALARFDSTDARIGAALAATRANWHAANGRWGEATKEFARLQELSPNGPHTWLKPAGLLRITLAFLKQNQAKHDLLAAAAAQIVDSGIAEHFRADSRFLEQVHALQSEVDRRLAENPNDALVRTVRAELYGLLGDTESQLADFNAAIENLLQRPVANVAADLTSLYRRRGDTRLALRQWQAALDDYAHIVMDKNNDEQLFINQAIAQAYVLLEGIGDTRLDRSDPWVRLARAYRLRNNLSAIDELVEQRLHLAGPVGDLFIQTTDRDWQRAVDIYSKAITPETTDETLLGRRALAYEGLKNWSAAESDWSRAAAGRPSGAKLLSEFALRLDAVGQKDLAKLQFERARMLLEKARQANSQDTVVVENLALLLLNTFDAASWVIIEPIEMQSDGGSTMTKLMDNSVLVGGKLVEKDLYKLTTQTSLSEITAVRLEALTDPSLPQNGPGRSPRGDFVLDSFRVQCFHGESRDSLLELALDAACTDNHLIGRPIKPGGEWHNAFAPDGTSLPHFAFYHVAVTTSPSKPAGLIFELVFDHGAEWHDLKLGRFRLSISSDPKAYANAEKRIAALKLFNPWQKLAAAYELVGDQQALDELLRKYPEAADFRSELRKFQP